MKDFAHKRLVKQKYIVMNISLLIHTMVRLVDDEDNTVKNIRTLGLGLEIISVISKLEYQNLFSDKYDSFPELLFTKRSDYKNTKKVLHRKTAIIVVNPETPFQTVFESNEKEKKKNEFFVLIKKFYSIQ